jgi:pimeloyl-[acyl-carrier protein] methyl ester esterase
VSLQVEQSGAGPDLVLLHGWGMNAAVWDGLPKPITVGRRTSRIELPGHGASPFETGHSGLAAWAGACLGAAPEKAVWLGWSLGGLVALEAAMQAPRRVAGLVLLTATPRFVQAPDWPSATAPETFAGFRDALIADPPSTLERFLALQVRGSDGARDALRTLRRELSLRPTAHPSALAEGLRLLRESDLRSRIGEIACPTLWVFGGRDTLVPAAVSESISALLPSARQEVVAGAGHAPFLSHPKETGASVAGFLEGRHR